jgi:hypothetical protein
LWLKVLFAGLLGDKNIAGWLLIWLNSSNEQSLNFLTHAHLFFKFTGILAFG